MIENKIIDIKLHNIQSIEKMADILQLLNTYKQNKNVYKITLNLNSKKIDEYNCESLFTDMTKLSRVEEFSLDIRNNWIMDNGVNYISEFIIFSKPLKKLRLNLYNNEIKDDGLVYLGDSLSYAKHIQNLYIDLAYNEFSRKGLNTLMLNLKKMDSIQSLYLNFKKDRINDSDCLTISDGIEPLKTLK